MAYKIYNPSTTSNNFWKYNIGDTLKLNEQQIYKILGKFTTSKNPIIIDLDPNLIMIDSSDKYFKFEFLNNPGTHTSFIWEKHSNKEQNLYVMKNIYGKHITGKYKDLFEDKNRYIKQ